MAYSYQPAMKETESIRKGAWLDEEDKRLIAIVALSGERKWDSIARASGLRRSGKSCRLRWLNYLRPNLKHDPISPAEEQIISKLHEQWGNKWSRIARRLPGRTDNEIKNYWRTHLRKKTTPSEDQGNFPGFTTNAKQDIIIQNPDTNSTETSYQDCSSSASASAIWKTADSDSYDVLESPLDPRIELSDLVFDQFPDYNVGFDYHHHGDCEDQYSYYPNWISKDDETSLWDCSDSLWDLD